MAAIAFHSVYRVGRVNAELSDVADYHLPLVNQTRHLHQLAERQLLLFEKLLDASRKGALDTEESLKWFKDFDDVGKQVDILTGRALSLSTKGKLRAVQHYDRDQFTRLETLFPILEQEHQSFHDHALHLIRLPAGAKASAGESRSALEEKLAPAQKRMDEVIQALAEFTQVSSQDATKHQNHVFLFNVLIIAIGAAAGLIFAVQLTLRLLRPVHRLVGAVGQVEKGDLDLSVAQTSRDEIGELTRAFNHMVGELKVRDRIKRMFGKYVDSRVVDELLAGDESKLDVVEKRVMTVSFCDLQGFTTLGEQLAPTYLAKLLNEYFEGVSNVVIENRGVIDKYIGDAVMAFWGPPFCDASEHATLGARAALRQLQSFAEVQRRLPEIVGLRKGLPEMNLRIGLCTGELVVGNLGSNQSRTYTVIGDTVNLASRLEGLNKAYGTNIIVNETLAEALSPDEFVLRELDRIRVKGKSEPVKVFEVVGFAADLPAARREVVARFVEGLACYREQRFDDARKKFEACVELSNDPPARVFIERTVHFGNNPPEPDWDGVWTFTTK